jgi:hypothetical protein
MYNRADILNKLLNYTQIYNLWLNRGATEEAAKDLTIQQIDAFEEIVSDDQGWENLLLISSRGRFDDAWLAADWPSGFDELLLCVPLCKLVDWECAKCTIGRRQGNYSCANENSVFGYIGELVNGYSRKELLMHLKSIRKMLKDEKYVWDFGKLGIELKP